MLWYFLACTPETPSAEIEPPERTPVAEPLPNGVFSVAFDNGSPINGSTWTSIPAGRVERDGARVVVDVQETWTEPTPYFPDCPVEVHLEGDATAADPYVYEVVSTEVYDPCAIGAYRPDTTYVVRFVPRDVAVPWLVDSLSISTSALEAGEAILNDTYGPSVDWFAFWGPAEDQLWPLGYVFPDATD